MCVASAERQAAEQDKTGVLAGEPGVDGNMQLAPNESILPPTDPG